MKRKTMILRNSKLWTISVSTCLIAHFNGKSKSFVWPETITILLVDCVKEDRSIHNACQN